MTSPKKKRTRRAKSIRLDGELTIQRAVDLHAELREVAEMDGDVELDLSAVTRIDTAGVQLLLMAERAARAKDKTLSLAGHSPAVVDVFHLLSLPVPERREAAVEEEAP